eukprot:evm.model.scf_2234.1 EVM.evm.TU.scf_2234.1   scf_2234:16348-23232(+)
MDTGSVATWSGVASCGVGVLLYMLSRHEGRKTQDLERAKPVGCLDDVMELTRLLPLLVALRGQATSEEPIQSEMTGTPSVLAEVTEELNALKQNDKGEWLPDCQLIRQQKWETNWHLTDSGRTRVGVENSHQADLLRTAMVLSAQEYREGNRNLYSRILDRLTGYRPLGVRKSERVLAVGSLITIVGELAQSTEDSQGKLVVRRPQNGGPFYISSKTLAELHESLSRVASTCKWLAFGFGAFGVLLIASRVYKSLKTAYRYNQMRDRIDEEERRRRARRSLNAQTSQKATGEDAGLDEGTEGKCAVCMEREAQFVFIPCGHLCCCEMCSLNLNKCPICRSRSHAHRVYQS